MESQTYKRTRTLLDHLKLNPGRDGHSADSKPRSEDRKSIFFPVRGPTWTDTAHFRAGTEKF